MPTIWDYEHKVSRRARRRRGQGWTRRAIFEGLPAATGESLIPAEYTPYPGESGTNPAVLMDSDYDSDWRMKVGGNLGRAVLYYRPLTFQEWLEAHPNHAVCLQQSGINSAKVRNLNGQTIEGKDGTDTTGLTRWIVTDGTNVKLTARAVYDVYGVTNDRDVYYYQFVAHVGKCNSTIMMKLPLAPSASYQHQWLLIGMSCAPRPTVARLFTVRYRFLLTDKPCSNVSDGYGWRSPCVSKKFTTETREVPLRDSTGTQVGVREVTVLVPTGDSNSVSLIQAANFSPIDGMLMNSW